MDFIDARNGSKLVSVTSTVPGEGKTFVAANLGAIIAMTNQKVCVVDIDMRKAKGPSCIWRSFIAGWNEYVNYR